MKMRIALAGNPNSGKTTMFNYLTGGNQYVGNWPGVTIEKKEGRFKADREVILQDLPGIYSLSPFSAEEVITRSYLIDEKPDAIVNIVDASNIERNLYLTTQLLEIGVPVSLAFNMIDVVNKRGDKLNLQLLSEQFGCDITETSALRGVGSEKAVFKAIELAEANTSPRKLPLFSEDIENAIETIASIITPSVAEGSRKSLRWFAIKVFERDKKILETLNVPEDDAQKLEAIIKSCEARHDDTSESIITAQRYDYIQRAVSLSVNKQNKSLTTLSDRIDSVVTNKILALPIFAIVMFLVYFLSISTIGGWATDFVNETIFGEDGLPFLLANVLEAASVADWLSSLVLDGIVAGLGAVLGFLPQMCVLFLCLALLEDCGYMARIAFIMDKLFHKFGLSGKSFIPILVGTGCGVPGIMASRTIENRSDRRMTVITTTFIPCSAKLPMISLIAGAIFPGAFWVAPSAYFAGIAAIVLSGIMLKKLKMFTGETSPFVMELPSYHTPGASTVFKTVFDRAIEFVKKAGTIILLATVTIWFLSSFDFRFNMVEAQYSILSDFGHIVAVIFTPLGFGEWRAAVACITGLIAKESVVGTLSILFDYTPANAAAALSTVFIPLSAYTFLLFNLLCAPCFAAIGAIRGEMKSPRWTFFAILYQTGFAYLASLIVYQLGRLVSGAPFSPATVFAFAAILLALFMLTKKPYQPRNLYQPRKEL